MARVSLWRRGGLPTPDEAPPDFESERKIIEAGREARRLLDSGVLDDARGELMARSANTAHDERGLREMLHAEMRAIERIRERLQNRANELARRGIDE